jgi:hypothetical protein
VDVIKAVAHQDSRKQGSCTALHEVKNNTVDRNAERAYAKVDSMPSTALDELRTAVIATEGRKCVGKTKVPG